MHLFRITEPANPKAIVKMPNGKDRDPNIIAPGIEFELDEEVAYIPLIEENKVVLPMSKPLSHAAQMAKAADYVIKQGNITRAEDGSLCLTRDTTPSQVAIVHIATQAGEGGILRVIANTYVEILIKEIWGSSRVEQITNEFPPPGVELLNPEHVEIEKECFVDAICFKGVCSWKEEFKHLSTTPPLLLRMVPNSSFRICRTGNLEGAFPEFLVSWNGNSLRTIVPKKILKGSGI